MKEMKTWTVNVVVELDFESVGEIELEVPMTDEQMDAIEQLENEYEEGMIEELDQDVFAECLPEIYAHIEDYVNKQMPNEIDLQEGESIDDYSWSISFSY